jgi:hypothetical protein
MRDFLVSIRDSAVIVGAVILVGLFKLTVSFIGAVVFIIGLLCITALAVILVIRDLILNIKGR